MNAYGDSQSARARVQVPGPSAASTPDDEPRSGGKPGPDAYRRPSGAASVPGSSGRASVGSASAGRASVGSAAVGSASPGRAAVGSATPGRASVGSASVGGRASVGAASVGGRASVSPGGPSGPAGPGGGGGSGGSGGSGGKKGRGKADKKHRRANILTAAAAVLVIMLGVGIVGGTYFFDDIKLPQPKAEAQMNTFYLAGSKQILQRTGSPRENVPYKDISENIKNAVIAAEDMNFRSHNGIDMKGIARAAWNNFTGGELQGASTITQQYARHVANEKDISYSRKLREAVIARKLESEYGKDEILGMYLNYIDLGRGRYGVESAAQGYFGKTVKKNSGAKEIDVYQAAVLASIIKQPYATDTHPGYDPANNKKEAVERWEYTLKNMREMGAITQEQYDKRKYPEAAAKVTTAKTLENKPVSMVMRHVLFELNKMGITEEKLEKGGYTITTTINAKVQEAAEKAGSKKSKSSPMNGQKKDYQAAVIGIDPKTGEVLGYYGGDDPNGIDYGGYMKGDGSGVPDDGSGGQSPGSTFKIYTLAAGQRADISFDSIWDSTLPRVGGGTISNAGADPGKICGGKIKNCDLETATIKSFNFPFYWIADKLGPDKVVEAAKDAGVGTMWTDDNGKGSKKIDLTKNNGNLTKYFDREVSFGQYRVLPLEHAQGVATIVNGGVRHDAHFVKQVKQRNSETGEEKVLWTASKKGDRVFEADRTSDLLGVLKKIPPAYNNRVDGRESVGKSGTWEIQVGSKNLSGDTWFVGGIPQLAVTVWVGGAGKRVALKEKNGDNMFGSGTPAAIWEEFIETAAKEMKWDEEKFPERIRTGNKEAGNGVAPPPPTGVDPNSQFCLIAPDNPLCQQQGGGEDGDNEDDNGGNNGDNGGNNGGGPGPR
jgi:membrane peptidoglycan carboxypeptidase